MIVDRNPNEVTNGVDNVVPNSDSVSISISAVNQPENGDQSFSVKQKKKPKVIEKSADDDLKLV